MPSDRVQCGRHQPIIPRSRSALNRGEISRNWPAMTPPDSPRARPFVHRQRVVASRCYFGRARSCPPRRPSDTRRPLTTGKQPVGRSDSLARARGRPIRPVRHTRRPPRNQGDIGSRRAPFLARPDGGWQTKGARQRRRRMDPLRPRAEGHKGDLWTEKKRGRAEWTEAFRRQESNLTTHRATP